MLKLMMCLTALTTVSCAFVKSKTTMENEPVSQKQVQLVEPLTALEVRWKDSPSELLLEVEAVDTCKTLEVTVANQYKVTERWSDYLWVPYTASGACVLSGALALGVAPTLSNKKGTDNNGDKTSSPRTTANTVGGLFATAAAGVLIYAVVQSVRSMDSQELDGRKIHTSVVSKRVCNRRLLANAKVSLGYSGQKWHECWEEGACAITVKTDDAGIAKLPRKVVRNFVIGDHGLEIPSFSIEVGSHMEVLQLPTWFLVAHEEERIRNRVKYARSLFQRAVRDLKDGKVRSAREAFARCRSLRAGI